MKIRCITLGSDISGMNSQLTSLHEDLLNLILLKDTFEKSQIEVESIRLATTPFTEMTVRTKFVESRDEYFKRLEEFVKEGLLNYYSFLPGLCDQTSSLSPLQLEIMEDMPRILKSTPSGFSSIQVASTQNGINFNAIQKSVDIIKRTSTPDPFASVYFAVTCNVEPNTPFFPSAYHQGTGKKISVAFEAADEVINILKKYPPHRHPLDFVRKQLQQHFANIYDKIYSIVHPYCIKNNIEFVGVDFSPAPYPTKEKSIGTALEQVGLSKFGEMGSVFAVGFLTQALQAVDRPKIGFSGFMQPVLEDYTIAQRVNDGLVDIPKLLLYSTMCGLGLDCVPIPGNADDDTIQLLLMDLAMISVRLNKPLTARLMPIPNKNANDMTNFDFEYFTDCKILDLPIAESPHLKKFLKANSHFKL